MNSLTQIYQIISSLLKSYFFFRHKKNWVTILGSARFSKQNIFYQKAYQLSQLLVSRGYSILTGGGYGIMEAASRGAKERKGIAVGCYVKGLESLNPYLHDALPFNSLMLRQLALIQYSKALIIFPGGFGTLDELMGALVLIQNKEKHFPIFLVGSDFWEPLMCYFNKTFLIEHKTINLEDLKAILVIDSVETILNHLGQ